MFVTILPWLDPGLESPGVLAAMMVIFCREILLAPTAVLGLAWRPTLD